MTNESPILDERPRPPAPVDDEYEYVEVEEGQGCSGCGWGMAGAFGCFAIPVVVIGFLLITGINTIGGIVKGIGSVFNPGPPVYNTVSTATVLESVELLSELTTTQYNFSDIIISERDLPGYLQSLYRDRLTLVVVGQIEAGIALNELSEGDIVIDGDTLILRLPVPRLQRCFINEEETSVVSRDTGFFASPADQLDRDARLYALDIFRARALENGILEEANAQAAETLRVFLETLPLENVTQVQVETQLPDPAAPPPLPESCR
jgi:hypothetical protein